MKMQIKALFATVAVGEKYSKLCLDSIKTFDKCGYDSEDELVIITDHVDLFKDVNCKIKLTVMPYYLPQGWPVVDKDNFRQNTIVKHLLLIDALKRDTTHNLFVWYDSDTFPCVKREMLEKYTSHPAGIYYKDCHKFNKEEEIIEHHLWQRGERYYKDGGRFIGEVLKSPQINLAKCEDNNLAFPVETCIIINRDLDDLEYKAKENKFYVVTHNLVKYCLTNYLDDNYGESFELSLTIGNSFGEVKQAPVIPTFCDFHTSPSRNFEQDREFYKDMPMFKEYLA